jgi:hypothetical protein
MDEDFRIKLQTWLSEPRFVPIFYRTTNSGKQLFLCTGCGREDPAPTKFHKCVK